MPSLLPITEQYLLVSGIPTYLDAQGNRYTDALWLKDLREHFRYLHHFTLASPLVTGEPPKGAAKFEASVLPATMNFVDLPVNTSFAKALLRWPSTFARLWRAFGKARIVHFGVAEWPLPSGWTVSLISRFRHRVTLVVIESAFWRTQGSARGIASRIKANLSESINRWCVNSATIAIFTQQQYANELLKDPSRGHILPASWIDADNVLSTTDVTSSWNEKLSRPGALLFAARLVEEKGVRVLLDALRLLRAKGTPATIDVIGSGPLEGEIDVAVRESDDRVMVRRLPPVPYGKPFFELVQKYDAMLIPSISDEQPRLVYDSFSQGVPVLASATPGLVACVNDGINGKLVPPGDAAKLADLIAWATTNRANLQLMGEAGLQVAQSYTHRDMHERRWKLIAETLAAQSAKTTS